MAGWTDSNIFVNSYPVKWMKFPGGEINVQINTPCPIISTNVTAILKSSDDIMALLLTVDALRNSGIEDFYLLKIPYFPYARQDRVCNPGEALSVKVMANLINSLGFQKVEIVDPHSDVTPALINNCKIIKPIEFISRIPNLTEYVLVSPDAGAEKKTYDLVKNLNVMGMVRMTKKRDIRTGEITSIELVDAINTHNNKFLIVDDICDGGRTFIEAAKVLNIYGSIDLYVTHGIFSQGFDVFRGYINTIYYSNSLNQNFQKSISLLNERKIV